MVLCVDFDFTLFVLFMFAGFVISAICELERNAIQLALGSFYPTLLLSGKLPYYALHSNRGTSVYLCGVTDCFMSDRLAYETSACNKEHVS